MTTGDLDDREERIARALEDEAEATARGDGEAAERARIEAALLMPVNLDDPKRRPRKKL